MKLLAALITTVATRLAPEPVEPVARELERQTAELKKQTSLLEQNEGKGPLPWPDILKVVVPIVVALGLVGAIDLAGDRFPGGTLGQVGAAFVLALLGLLTIYMTFDSIKSLEFATFAGLALAGWAAVLHVRSSTSPSDWAVLPITIYIVGVGSAFGIRWGSDPKHRELLLAIAATFFAAWLFATTAAGGDSDDPSPAPDAVTASATANDAPQTTLELALLG
jgi:hypothetical protein